MKSKGISKLNESKSKNLFENIKSKYIFQIIFNNLPKKRKLEIIKYTKNTQNKININFNDHKVYSEKYSSIEIEIIPSKIKKGPFIYIKNQNDEKYYYIYFNDNYKKEIKRTSFIKKDKIQKINILINYKLKSLEYLFFKCTSIKSIYFKHFKNKNINNMSCMFYGCSSLKEINLSMLILKM